MNARAGLPTTGAPDAPKPFKAAQSYGPADGDLFFGRDAEGAMLSRFLSERPLGVITAPSGTGKTSLLHAKVLPLLERGGWLPVYARPRDEPLNALQAALVDYLLPDPAVEADVIERLARALPPEVPPTLAAALHWHAASPPAQRVRWRLFAPHVDDEFAALPMVCRALRGSLGEHDLIEHFEALVADGPAMGLGPQTPLAGMARHLRAESTGRLWQGWRDRFGAGDVADALSAFQVDWAPLRPGLAGIILIVDQFEELFTQFDATTVSTFLGHALQWLAAVDTERGMTPVHVALSLRKEFFADLVPHLRAFGTVERLTYFLDTLPAEQASQALAKPAELFGLTFTRPSEADPIGCLTRVLTLALDDGESFSAAEFAAGDAKAGGGRFTPVLISLIGAHLWERLQLPAHADVPMPLAWDDFQRLVPHLDDVFSTFLGAAMRRVDDELAGRANRFDALEMLDRLVTSTGFRNIIAEVDLVEQLPLLRDDARTLVDKADHELKLIRRESRRGGYFVEIMHERLIPPVRRMLGEMRRNDPLRASLAAGHATLQLLADEPDPTHDALPDYLRASLVAFLPRLQLSHLAAKNLLRSLLWAGPEVRRDADDRGRLGEWQAAICRLVARVAQGPGDAPAREALLHGAQLDRAIDDVEARPDAVAPDLLRQVLSSVLADRTREAGPRILRAFASTPLTGAACVP